MTEYGGFTYPTLSPYVFYEDLPAALEFLADAFGFTVRMRNENPDGSLSHPVVLRPAPEVAPVE